MSKFYKNYFNPKTVAERYLKGCPQYHSFVIEKITESLSIKMPFALALDIGCGTGFSSKALRKISERVLGIDFSFEMTNLAIQENGIEYVVASAESLPVCNNKFELITVSQAIHWIDRKKFFAEAYRVLQPNSFIIAYDNYFLGEIKDNLAFSDWYKEVFLINYPTPPRERKAFETESNNPKDFVLVREEWHENYLQFSKQQLIDYLITITNVINRVDKGEKTIDEVFDWLMNETEHFFTGKEKQTFVFTAPIRYLKQSN